MRLPGSPGRQGHVQWDGLLRHMVAHAASILALAAPGTGSATVFNDAAGDFLPSYTGAQNGDVDIVSGSATHKTDQVRLSLTLNGAIGSTTATPFCLFGVNRGSGTDRLVTSGPPAVGDSTILFDAVVRFDFDGNGRVVTFASATSPPVTTLQFVYAVSGDTDRADIPWTALPSTGFAADEYTYVAWSRAEFGSQQCIADLAPAANILAVPEPAGSAPVALGILASGVPERSRQKGRQP